MFEAIEGLMRTGKWEDALFACDARLQLQPTIGRLHAYKGICLFRLNRFADAEPCFKRGYLLDPQLSDSAVKHAQCLERLHRYREAMDVVKEWLPKIPNDATLGGLYEFLKTQYSSEEHDRWEKTVRIEARVLPSEGTSPTA